MANCLTCIHQEVCKERMEIFNLPNIACQYEAHELRGEWIIRRDKQGAHIYSVCSKCNVPYLDTDFPNFCPNCGSNNRRKVKKSDRIH